MVHKAVTKFSKPFCNVFKPGPPDGGLENYCIDRPICKANTFFVLRSTALDRMVREIPNYHIAIVEKAVMHFANTPYLLIFNFDVKDISCFWITIKCLRNLRQWTLRVMPTF